MKFYKSHINWHWLLHWVCVSAIIDHKQHTRKFYNVEELVEAPSLLFPLSVLHKKKGQDQEWLRLFWRRIKEIYLPDLKTHHKAMLIKIV